VGRPVSGELSVPTDVVPVFSSFEAGDLNSTYLAEATFELSSAAGETIAVTAQMTFSRHFELIPSSELEPSTEYTIVATLPPRAAQQTGVEVSLSFTTGSGPLTEPPAPPNVKMLHYHAEVSGTLCDPGGDGSCLFFPSGTAVVITQPGDSSPTSRLTFDPWWENLSGVNQGTPWTCVTLRARAIDGTLSDPVDVCRDEAEIVNLPSTLGLRCTENGIYSPPPMGTGGSVGTGGSSGTSGSDAGGTSAGGAQTGGTGMAGTSAGAPDDDPSRTVVTEGCGCRVPGASNRTGSPAWLALVALLVVRSARRRRGF
jgi:MYXO-CTERM domain-containing protein